MSKIIRTPTKALGGITPTEQLQLAEVSQFWTANAMRTDPVDPKRVEAAVKALYAASGCPSPKVIVVPSPKVMALAGVLAACTLEFRARGLITTDIATYAAMNAATHTATRDATDIATRDATRDAADIATRDATDTATHTATRDATDTATHTATWNATHAATWDATWNATRDATDTATWNATWNATHAATWNATDNVTRDATDTATWNATDTATRDAAMVRMDQPTNWYLSLCEHFTNSQLAPLVTAVLPRWSSNYQGGNMWSAYASHLAAMRDVLKLTDLPCWEKYASWETCAIEGGFRYMHEDFCMVSDRPRVLKVDAENRPHCEDGPSHLWSDGWALYHWHGVAVPSEWITDKASLTAATALTWKNIEQRLAACKIIGWARIVKELDAKVIDVDGDPEIGTLLEVGIPDVGKERFVQVVCGTGRTFCLPVPRTCKTALEANAWSYGLDGDTYRPEVRT